DGEQLSYAALCRRVNQLANGLSRRGIGQGTHVGVMLPNISALPVTWLAIARLGAVMVPLNIAYTARELDYVVNNGDVEWLMIESTQLPTLAGMAERPQRLTDQRVIVVGEGAPIGLCWKELLEGESDVVTSPAAVGLDDLLNIQYTSGTT